MTTPVRVGLAAALATTLVVAMAARGFSEFPTIRIKLVESSMPATGTDIRVDTGRKPRVNALPTPFAVIAHLHNGTGATQAFAISIDGRAVCDVRVGPDVRPDAASRVDCAASGPLAATSDHEVLIHGPAGGWVLEYLELATHHGGSSGGFFIVPAGATSYARPDAAWLVGTWLAVFLVTAFVSGPTPRPLLILGRIVVALGAASFAGLMLAPLLSPYRVIVSTDTFVRVALLLVIGPLWTIGRWIAETVSHRWADWAPVGACLLVALLVGWGYEIAMARQLHDFYHGNYSGLLDIARDEFDRNPMLSGRDDIRRSLLLKDGGYDGQFMYFATFDPFMRAYRDNPGMYRRVMDAPPYRFGRIGFSLLTKALSLDQWRRYPATMIWLILAGTAACGFVVALIGRANGATPAWGLVVLLIPGFWMSVEAGLPEPIAAAAALGGYWLATRRAWLGAAVLFALSLLVRETGVVIVLAAGLFAYRAGHRREGLLMAAIGIAPIVMWRAYVGWTLFPDWHWQGFFFNPHDLGVPFGGFVDLWRAVINGSYPAYLRLSAVTYPTLLTLAFVFAVVLAVRRPGPATVAAVVYGLVAVSLNYEAIWVHVGNGQRGTFEVFTWLAVASAGLAGVSGSRLERISVAAFWTLAAGYLLYGGFDSAFLRTAFF